MSIPQPQRSLLPKNNEKGKDRGTGKKRAVEDVQPPEREPSQSSSSSSLYSVLPLGPNTQAGSSSRRRIIQNACEPCRKRKVKCDGASPSCSTCAATPQTDCYYETDADRRRKGALRRDIQILTQQNNNLNEENSNLSQITKAIRQGSDVEVEDLLYLLRLNESYDAIAKSLETSTTHDIVAARIASSESLDAALAEFSKLTPDTFESPHYGHTSGLGACKTLSSTTPPITPQNNSWITVTRDSDLIHHLLDMYFTWHHPIYGVFSRDLFLGDMETGATNFCSSLLLNAVLAVGCHFSGRHDQARTDRDDPRTSGARFIMEARRLLADEEKASLTTVQALAVLVYAEVMSAHESQSFRNNQLMMSMAVEMGMHRTEGHTEDPNDPLCTIGMSACRHTFWACYNISVLVPIMVGRLPLLPVTAINTPRLSPHDERKNMWKPVFDDLRYDDLHTELEQQDYPMTVIFYTSLLLDIANDMLFMFYAPRERLTTRILLQFYDRFQKWFSNLPECLAIHLDMPSPPQFLHLHLWYHACIINLFRPFMKATLDDSTVIPRAVCTKSAIIIVQIVQRYHTLYGLRRIAVSFHHGMIMAATVQIDNMSEDYENRGTDAAAHIAILIGAFQEMAANQSFSVRALQIILGLAARSPNVPPNLQAAINEGRLTLLSISDAWKRTKNIQSMERPGAIAPEMHSGGPSFPGTPFGPGEVAGQPRSGLISRNSGVDLTSYHEPGLVQQPSQPGMSQPPPGPNSSQIPATYDENFYWSAYPGQGIPMHLPSLQEGSGTYSMMPEGGVLPSTPMATQLSREGFGLPDARWYQHGSGDPWNQGQQQRD